MSDTFINVVLLSGIVFFIALIVDIIFEIKDRKKKKLDNERITDNNGRKKQ